MTSHYTVIQYGNVITGEYLNIAVFAYDDNKLEVYSQFSVNWTRVNEIFESENAHKDPIFESILEHHLKEIKTKVELQRWVKDSQSPFSSLLFTDLRPSDLPAEQLLEEMSKRFLTE
jgi:hypothetical protein